MSMKGFACIRVFNGMGQQVDEVIMTKRTLYIGRAPAGGSPAEASDPNVQYVLVPQECRGVSKLRHVKIYWRVVPSPSFVAEVVGRCNGACILGTQYKESCTVLLPESSVSTISIGQSCYIYFSPAVRVFSNLKLQPSIDAEEADGEKKAGGHSAGIKRFPKLWVKSIIDVFAAAGTNELTQASLVEHFKTLHEQAVTLYYNESQDIDGDLWSDLKRFVLKTPFEFNGETSVIRFDPASVKPRAPPGAKKQKVGSSDGEDVTPPAALADMTESPEAVAID